MSARTLEQINADLLVASAELPIAARAGHTARYAAKWAIIDRLLDELLPLLPVVPPLPDTTPRPLDGRVVHRTEG